MDKIANSPSLSITDVNLINNIKMSFYCYSNSPSCNLVLLCSIDLEGDIISVEKNQVVLSDFLST